MWVYLQKTQEVDHLFIGASFSFSRKDAFPRYKEQEKKKKKYGRGFFFNLFEELLI